jgi:peptidyl-prolyl cis-trans isomerase C
MKERGLIEATVEWSVANARSVVGVTLVAALLAAAPAVAAQNAAPAAKVNGANIPQYRLDAAIKSRIAQGQQDSPEMRKSIRDQLINQEVVAQEALKRGLEKQPHVAARIELDRQSALVSAYFEDHLRKNPITDEMLRKEYERLKPELPAREYKVRHILVEKEDDAKNIIAQIRKGASFEKLAAEHSKDSGSRARGGDLDWGPAERYVKPFAEAVTRLKKGAMTDTPVQTDFGFHVIRVDDERATKVPTFEEAKQQLHQIVQNQIVQRAIADLRSKAKVE